MPVRTGGRSSRTAGIRTKDGYLRSVQQMSKLPTKVPLTVETLQLAKNFAERAKRKNEQGIKFENSVPGESAARARFRKIKEGLGDIISNPKNADDPMIRKLLSDPKIRRNLKGVFGIE
jgi:hypothetical protein